MKVTRKLIGPLMLTLCACQTGGAADGGGQGGVGGERGLGGAGGQGGSATANPLGMLVECDQVIEEMLGSETIVRRQVALLPVTDPTSVTITRCDTYEKINGELLVPLHTGSKPDRDCYTSGSWAFHHRTGFNGLTFTPNSEVYVECEEENTFEDERTSTYGSGRVYVRTDLEDRPPRVEKPLGVAVECDETIERTVRIRHADDEWVESVERRKVAYVPVEDPTAVAITSCGYYSAFDGALGRSSADCVTSLRAELTPEFEVIVECETETTYSIGWSGLPQGGVGVTGYEHVYLRIDSTEAIDALENPLGMLVECDETYEWQYSEDSQYRESVAYLPVADPTSGTLTRCDEADNCVVNKSVSFTDDFDVYVRCLYERTGRLPTTIGYDSIYYRVD